MDKTTLTNKRIIAIDRFRGLTIFLMVLANFFDGVEWIPGWMKHAVPPGLTIVDLIAPAFFFVIALTFPLSFQKRKERDGKQNATAHALIRGFAIIGIGFIISAGESLFVSDDGILSFGVLEVIGFTLVMAVPFVLSPLWVKSLAAIIIGCLHQFLIIPLAGESILAGRYEMAGMLGPLSLLLFGLIMSDLFFKRKNHNLYIVFSAGFLIGGIILGFWLPINRTLYSLSLGIICTGINSTAFFIMHLISKKYFMRHF